MQTINGTFIQNLPIVEGDSNRGHWLRGGFVIEFGEDYPRKLAFSSFGEDKVATHRNIPTGTPVQVRFSPESREYNGRWYTELRCISVLPLVQTAYPQPQAQPMPSPQPAAPIQPNLGFDSKQQPPAPAPFPSTSQAQPAPVAMPAEKDDDLPF